MCMIAMSSDSVNLLNSIKMDTRLRMFHDNSDPKANYVFLAKFDKSDKVTINAYKSTIYIFQPDLDSIEEGHVYVSTSADWFYKSELWFRYNKIQNCYQAFNSYTEQYREKFSVDYSKPLLIFSVNI